MDHSDLGNRMKEYEGRETNRKFLPMLPICVRLDGKAFHSFTKNFDRPYDVDFIMSMRETTKWLMEEIDGCILGYCQSDEITLILYSDNYKSQVFFDGKPTKLNSVIASMCTMKFNSEIKTRITNIDKYAFFDCRSWQVPNKEEAVNVLVWREQDATRNSIQMAGQAHFSHMQLMNKTCNQIKDMLINEKGVNWNGYPDFFKKGTYFRRENVLRAFFPSELEKIPEAHRPKPTDMISRKEVIELGMPPINRVVNRVNVIFDGAEPEVLEENA